MGRVSKTFKREIPRHYKRLDGKHIPTSCTSIVIGNVIDIHLDAWKDCYRDIHGNSGVNTEYSSHKDYKIAVVNIYYSKNSFLSCQDKK